jgi:subtilase family serine protease
MFCRNFLAVALMTIVTVSVDVARTAANAASGPQIVSPIDETQNVALRGSTPPAVSQASDLGRVPDSTAFPGLELALRRPAAQERALENLMRDQLNPKSPRFHHWLKADAFGRKFGVAVSDIGRIEGWLRLHGFRIVAVSKSRMRISFAGTAGTIGEAFHTEIHRVRIGGADHITNMSDPQIPAALAPAIAGVAWLNDFRPKPQYTGAQKCQPYDNQGVADSTCYWIVPADLRTIYNFPASTYDGTGQTIVLMEDSPPCCTSDPSQDWCSFRTTFFPSATCPGQLFSVQNPISASSGQQCLPPGGLAGESAIDPQWASAAAPGANIVIATCRDNSATTPGYLIALENWIDLYSGQIISISFGFCEASLGAGGNAVLNSAYQQADAEGFSVFAAAGDGGAAGCDYTVGNKEATQGITESGYATSPYVVAVGGTTFADWALHATGTYWSTQNGLGYGSAQSYIPEIAWNSTCGNPLLAGYYTGSELTYGPTGFCNNAQYNGNFLVLKAGSGGPSSIYTKPSWQSGILGNPGDNARDVPDISIVAGGAEWGHPLVYCDSSPTTKKACTSSGPSSWFYSNGTSFSAPIIAGVQALINQRVGRAVGDPVQTYYALARGEYGQTGNPGCVPVNVTAGNNCVFYDVSALNAAGDSANVVPCVKNQGQAIDCFLDGAKYGVLSTDNNSYQPAYVSQTGWDFTSGVGSPNVTNLINAWPVPSH